jgi:uncharacterized protein YhaN
MSDRKNNTNKLIPIILVGALLVCLIVILAGCVFDRQVASAEFDG